MKTKTARLASFVKNVPPDRLACLFHDHVRWPEQYASKRNRLYAAQNTFWMFLAQVLATGSSCQETVARLLAGLAAVGQHASANTASYCEARKRLPQEGLDDVLRQVTSATHAHANEPKRMWCGRRVKVVDGSSVSMPDTPANQAQYPQPGAQKPGCGFPVARLTVFFCLVTGVVLAYANAALTVAERTLFHDLWDSLEQGDVVLADRGFCSYADFYVLGRRGVDCVMRKHQRRGKTSLVEKRLGKNDVLMVWMKTSVRPEWLDEQTWRAMPASLVVREIAIAVQTPGFRTKHITVATTLLDPKAFPKQAFEQLYRRRWMIELFLRDLKTTMGMEVLRCKSPAMIHKELAMHFIVYNLLRAAIYEATQKRNVSPYDISFKSALATLRQWAPHFDALTAKPRKRASLYRLLLQTLLQNRIPHRPDRAEPRAKKRRPKNYPLLNKPRGTFKEIPHRNRYHAA
jgi:hypothetical protein